MSFVIYQNPEDSTRVCIMMPTGEVPIGELILRHVATPCKVCDQHDIVHLDKDFVDSWQLINDEVTGAKNVVVNINNAKTQWRQKLRNERIPILQQLDIQYMRALETSDSGLAAETAAKKQRLRDAPSDVRIEAAATTDDLKRITLDSLL